MDYKLVDKTKITDENKIKEWNGAIYRTEINKFVHAELYNELNKMPANVRVKRLLTLATVGLTLVKGQSNLIQSSINTNISCNVAESQNIEKNEEEQKFKEDTKGKLLSSLKNF